MVVKWLDLTIVVNGEQFAGKQSREWVGKELPDLMKGCEGAPNRKHVTLNENGKIVGHAAAWRLLKKSVESKGAQVFHPFLHPLSGSAELAAPLVSKAPATPVRKAENNVLAPAKPRYVITLQLGDIDALFTPIGNGPPWKDKGVQERLQTLGYLYTPLNHPNLTLTGSGPSTKDGDAHVCWEYYRDKVHRAANDAEALNKLRDELAGNLIAESFPRRGLVLPPSTLPAPHTFAAIRLPGGYGTTISPVTGMRGGDHFFNQSNKSPVHEKYKFLIGYRRNDIEDCVWEDNPMLGRIPIIARVEAEWPNGSRTPANDAPVLFQLSMPEDHDGTIFAAPDPPDKVMNYTDDGVWWRIKAYPTKNETNGGLDASEWAGVWAMAHKAWEEVEAATPVGAAPGPPGPPGASPKPRALAKAKPWLTEWMKQPDVPWEAVEDWWGNRGETPYGRLTADPQLVISKLDTLLSWAPGNKPSEREHGVTNLRFPSELDELWKIACDALKEAKGDEGAATSTFDHEFVLWLADRDNQRGRLKETVKASAESLVKRAMPKFGNKPDRSDVGLAELSEQEFDYLWGEAMVAAKQRIKSVGAFFDDEQYIEAKLDGPVKERVRSWGATNLDNRKNLQSKIVEKFVNLIQNAMPTFGSKPERSEFGLDELTESEFKNLWDIASDAVKNTKYVDSQGAILQATPKFETWAQERLIDPRVGPDAADQARTLVQKAAAKPLLGLIFAKSSAETHAEFDNIWRLAREALNRNRDDPGEARRTAESWINKWYIPPNPSYDQVRSWWLDENDRPYPRVRPATEQKALEGRISFLFDQKLKAARVRLEITGAGQKKYIMDLRNAWVANADDSDPQKNNVWHERGGKLKHAKGIEAVFEKPSARVPGFHTRRPKQTTDFGTLELATLPADQAKHPHAMQCKTNNKGFAGVVFTPSRCGGDSYKLHAYIDDDWLKQESNGPAHTASVSSGTFVVWRNLRLYRYLQMANPQASGTDLSPGLKEILAKGKYKPEDAEYKLMSLDSGMVELAIMPQVDTEARAYEAVNPGDLLVINEKSDHMKYRPVQVSPTSFKKQMAWGYCEWIADCDAKEVMTADERASATRFARSAFERWWNTEGFQPVHWDTIFPVIDDTSPFLLNMRTFDHYNEIIAATPSLSAYTKFDCTGNSDKAKLTKGLQVFFEAMMEYFAGGGVLPGFTIVQIPRGDNTEARAGYVTGSSTITSGYGTGARGLYVSHTEAVYHGIFRIYPNTSNTLHELGHVLGFAHQPPAGADLISAHQKPVTEPWKTPAVDQCVCVMSYSGCYGDLCGECLLSLRGCSQLQQDSEIGALYQK